MRGDFLLVCGRLQNVELVVFLFLLRLECQLAGLASPRASVLAYLSDGEAGVTLAVFLASSFSESIDFYDFWVCICLGDGEAG